MWTTRTEQKKPERPPRTLYVLVMGKGNPLPHQWGARGIIPLLWDDITYWQDDSFSSSLFRLLRRCGRLVQALVANYRFVNLILYFFIYFISRFTSLGVCRPKNEEETGRDSPLALMYK
jgi:hypothetical protein